MYTAHYQGTAQVAVIAGLAESSGPLKARRRNFRARIVFLRAAVMVSGQPCGSPRDSSEEKSWGGARKHLRWSGNNPKPSSMLLPSWIPALTGLREDSRPYPL